MTSESSRIFVLMSILLGFLAFGCDGSGSGDGGNRPPVIEDINVNPPNPETNQINNDLTATATDPDGDELSYVWSADGGRFGSTTGNPVDWDAPSEPGQYQIECTVSDGQLTTTDSITVTVESGS